MLESADNGAIAEEHFLRGYRLWTQRHIPIAWPVEPRGYTFLGNAVHLVGAALFPDWTGEEPAEFHLPALERGTLQEASANKRGFAKAILLKFDREAVRDGGRFDLSIAEWERAIALYSVNVFPNIAAARRKMVKLMRVIVDGAAHQKLFMVTRNQFGLPVASSPSEWATEWAYPRFAECQMNPSLPFTNTHPPVLLGANLPGDRIDLLPGNQWIFVETESLQTFISEITPDRPASADNRGNGEDASQRLPALIKSEIKALLRAHIKKWNDGGQSPDLRIGKDEFTDLAGRTISDAKVSWSARIWLENRPKEWGKSGPR